MELPIGYHRITANDLIDDLQAGLDEGGMGRRLCPQMTIIHLAGRRVDQDDEAQLILGRACAVMSTAHNGGLRAVQLIVPPLILPHPSH